MTMTNTMNVLHYSFSLSACPKCHLLICKHTSLADLDFKSTAQQSQAITNESITSISREDSPHQQHSPHAMNFYRLPSTASDTRHSWTTFDADSMGSSHILNNLSSNSEDIPFAYEHILHSSLMPTFKPFDRTQSECSNHHLLQSYSFASVYNKSSSFSSISDVNPKDRPAIHSSPYSKKSFFTLLILLVSFLFTNTIDIVLLYTSYQTNYIYFIALLSTIILCETILWINRLIQFRTISLSFVLVSFLSRLYILYQLVELFASIIFERISFQTTHSLLIHSLRLYKRKTQRVFEHLSLFYRIHSGFVPLITLLFWSHNFQLSTNSLLNMNYFIPQWTLTEGVVSSTSTTLETHTSLSYPKILPNWTHLFHSSSNPVFLHFPSAKIFIITSILYHLIINYSLLSTCLMLERYSLTMILSRLCLILTRIYALLFLFRFNSWWLPAIFGLVHILLIIPLLLDQLNRQTILLQIIFSLLTYSSIDNLSINALILFENLSIFLHRLYLESSSVRPSDITLRLIIFISILISLQILGFILDIFSRKLSYRSKKINKRPSSLSLKLY